MKCILLLFISVAASAANVLKDSQFQGYKEGDRYFYFSGNDGVVHLIDAEEPVDTATIDSYMRNPDSNTYWLFTRDNPVTAHVLSAGNIESIWNSTYDSSKLTVFLVHGWNANGESYMNKLLTEAFLEIDDVNVIVLDWSKLASKGYTTAKAGTAVAAFLEIDDVNVIVLDWSKLANKGYSTAKAGTAAAGTRLGQFINWLIANTISTYGNIHLVGFSLGGHLVGNAGRETESAVARITALDPAGPLWSSDENRLTPTDAQYVEVIHTNTGFLGYTDPCGAADFYPNGGSSMPGCWFSPCSHSRAFEYMASSIKHNHFMANECTDHKEASRDSCTGPQQPMGNGELYKNGRGIFRVNTERYYPF